VAYDIGARADLIGEVFGAGQGLTHQMGHPLPWGGVTTLAVGGCAAQVASSVGRGGGHDTGVPHLLSGVKDRRLAIHHRPLRPQPFGAFAAAIPGGKGHHLAALDVHRAPPPWRVGLLLHQATRGVSFPLQALPHHVRVARARLDLHMLGPRLHAGDEPTEAPLEPTSHGAAHTPAGQSVQAINARAGPVCAQR
jgi:hypothetical protein